MSNTEFHREASKLIKQFERNAKHMADIAELRKQFREEHKMIYVKTYTVQSHMRKLTPRRRRAASASFN